VRRLLVLALFALAASLAAPFGDRPARADEPTWQARLDAKAGSVVCVRFVLKTRISMMGQTDEQERKSEARGAVVDPSGLVMLANGSLEGDFAGGALAKMLGRGSLEMSATPSNLNVLFANESKEYPAVVVARDSNLGLAFVQILDLEGRKPEAVDLAKGADPQVGATLFGVTRRGRAFDCAPEIDRLFVTGKVDKPRPLWGVSGDFDGAGLPVYGADGVPVGVLAVQQGVDAGDDAGGGGGGLSSLLGAASDVAASSGTFVVPVEAVAKSLAAARKRVPEALEKAAKAKADAAKADAEKPPEPPAAPKPPDGQPPK
jgi:hypothetical protein